MEGTFFFTPLSPWILKLQELPFSSGFPSLKTPLIRISMKLLDTAILIYTMFKILLGI